MDGEKSSRWLKYLVKNFYSLQPNVSWHKRNCSQDIITIETPWSSFIRIFPSLLSHLFHHNEWILSSFSPSPLSLSLHVLMLFVFAPLFLLFALFYRPCNVFWGCICEQSTWLGKNIVYRVFPTFFALFTIRNFLFFRKEKFKRKYSLHARNSTRVSKYIQCCEANRLSRFRGGMVVSSKLHCGV